MTVRGPWAILGGLAVAAGAASALRHRRPGPAVVVYDGACPMCRAAVERLQRWDARRALRYADGRDPAEVARLAPAAAGLPLTEMRLAFPDGSVLGGYDAVRALALLLPVMAPAAPLLFAPGTRPVGAAVYRRIAARRPLPHACRDGLCGLAGEPVQPRREAA